MNKIANKKPTYKEQGPHMWGSPTFSGTKNYGIGNHRQLAAGDLNPATKKILDQEKEIYKNLTQEGVNDDEDINIKSVNNAIESQDDKIDEIINVCKKELMQQQQGNMKERESIKLNKLVKRLVEHRLNQIKQQKNINEQYYKNEIQLFKKIYENILIDYIRNIREQVEQEQRNLALGKTQFLDLQNRQDLGFKTTLAANKQNLGQQKTLPANKLRAQAGSAERSGRDEQILSFEQLRKLLNTKSIDQISKSGVDVHHIINYIRNRHVNDLAQDFIKMNNKEIETLETVIDKNLDKYNIGPYYNKIEIATNAKHIHNLRLADTKQQQSTNTDSLKSKKSNPVKQLNVPKFSQPFMNAVQKYFNSIKQNSNLTLDQKEKKIGEIGKILYQPDMSEDTKLKMIKQIASQKYVDFDQILQSTQQTKNLSSPKITQQQNVFGKVKKFFGLNEVLDYLLSQDEDSTILEYIDRKFDQQFAL